MNGPRVLSLADHLATDLGFFEKLVEGARHEPSSEAVAGNTVASRAHSEILELSSTTSATRIDMHAPSPATSGSTRPSLARGSSVRRHGCTRPVLAFSFAVTITTACQG